MDGRYSREQLGLGSSQRRECRASGGHGAPGVLAGSARGSDVPPQAQGHDGFQGSVIFREKVVLCDSKAAAPLVEVSIMMS